MSRDSQLFSTIIKYTMRPLTIGYVTLTVSIVCLEVSVLAANSDSVYWPQTVLCFDNVTCDERCGPQRYRSPYYERVMCYCDGYCSSYGDCCPGYDKTSCPETSNKDIVNAIPYSTCGWLIENGMELPELFMVSKCPTTESWLRDRCEKIAAVITDSVMLQDPVFNLNTTLLYKNVYCSQCHGVKLSVVEFWELYRLGPPTIQLEIRHFMMIPEDNDISLKWYSNHDHASKGFRLCMEQTALFSCKDTPTFTAWNYDLCPVDADPVTSQLCQLYDYPALVGDVWFKNRYCAHCQIETPISTCERIRSEYAKISCGIIAAPSNYGLEGLLYLSTICKRGEFMDPITGECRPGVMCRPGFIFWKNRCLRDPYNSVIYKPPKTRDGEDGILIQYTMNTDREFVTVIDDNQRTMADIKFYIYENLKEVVLTGLRLKDGEKIVELDMPSPVTRLLIGGTDVQILKDTEITLLFWHPHRYLTANFFYSMTSDAKKRTEHMQRLVHHTVGNTLHVWTRNVQLPITCDEGHHITVNVDDDMWDYLSFATVAWPAFMKIVLENDEEKNQTVIHLCDTLDKKFHECDLLQYNTTDFHTYDDRIVHTATAYVFMKANFYVQDDSIYVCVNNSPLNNDSGLKWITQIGLILSNIFLILTFFTYLYLPKLSGSLPGKLMMNLCVVLFIAQLVFLIVMNVENIGPLCQPLAILGHYAWLCVFFWMSSIAINTFRTFSNLLSISRNQSKQLIIFSIYSYSFPLAIVSICIALHYTNTVHVYAGGLNGDTQPGICWIYSDIVRACAFILPLALVVLTNTILFILTCNIIRKTKKETAMATDGLKTRDVIVFIKLSLLLGFTWVFGVLGAIWPNIVVLYLFVILNSLCGVLIGVGFVCTKRVFWMCRKQRKGTTIERTSVSAVSGKYSTSQTTITSPT